MPLLHKLKTYCYIKTMPIAQPPQLTVQGCTVSNRESRNSFLLFFSLHGVADMYMMLFSKDLSGFIIIEMLMIKRDSRKCNGELRWCTVSEKLRNYYMLMNRAPFYSCMV